MNTGQSDAPSASRSGHAVSQRPERQDWAYCIQPVQHLHQPISLGWCHNAENTGWLTGLMWHSSRTVRMSLSRSWSLQFTSSTSYSTSTDEFATFVKLSVFRSRFGIGVCDIDPYGNIEDLFLYTMIWKVFHVQVWLGFPFSLLCLFTGWYSVGVYSIEVSQGLWWKTLGQKAQEESP